MKLLEKSCLWLITVIGLLIVVHAPIAVFVGTRLPELMLVVKAWKEVLILVLVLLMVILVSMRAAWKLFVRDWLFWALLGYVLLHVGYAVYGFATGASGKSLLSGLAIDLRYVAYFSVVYAYVRLYPHCRSWLVRVGAVGAGIVLVFAAMQLILPRDTLSYIGYGASTIQPHMTVDQNEDFVRFGSTLRGPNPLGAYAAITLIAIASLAMRVGRTLTRRMLALALFAAMFAGIALWISYSRSAGIAAVLGILIVIGIRYSRVIPKAAWLGLASFAVIAGLGLMVFRDVPVISNVVFHENPGEGGQIDSNEAHVNSLSLGIQRMIAQPLGAGVGTTGSASLFSEESVTIENHYLFVAHETGWLGLAMFVTIFIEILRRLWLRRFDWLSRAIFASGIGMAVIGTVLPVWVDDTVSIIWWGAAAIALGVMSKRERDHGATEQKTA